LCGEGTVGVKKALLILALLIATTIAQGQTICQAYVNRSCPIKICFSPSYGGENCLSNIVSEIRMAQKRIAVQAYVLTSEPIIRELVNAHSNGVIVTVVVDKLATNYMNYLSALTSNNIPVLVDSKHYIAHNKVMIIDEDTVITGSYNFTKAAETKNSENLVIINDSRIWKQYNDQFAIHLSHSRFLNQ
jgi:phosphatidylserine/phosphatidylglycerophosphate/cardiolipin synthase-like enzyme